MLSATEIQIILRIESFDKEYHKHELLRSVLFFGILQPIFLNVEPYYTGNGRHKLCRKSNTLSCTVILLKCLAKLFVNETTSNTCWFIANK